MKQMKKLLAFVLAFAMIITIYQPSAAYAATKKTRLNAKTMTLQVGQKKTLKVKNAGKKAKLKWSSNKKSIAPNTLTKMRKDGEVSMSVLLKIATYLDCDISDICEFVKDEE